MTLDGVITSWSPAAARMFGCSIREIIGTRTDLDGAVLGASVIARDVTGRQALAAAQQLAAIIELGRCDHEHESRRHRHGRGPSRRREVGYSSKEMVDSPIELLTPKDRAGEAKAVPAKINANQPVEHLETYRVRRGGRLVPASLTASPIRDADGAAIGASAIVLNITNRSRNGTGPTGGEVMEHSMAPVMGPSGPLVTDR